ncbi:hypothetical protein CPC08DRAFT_377624 [Agrocybe pediades]|nr:hypothetical protein CPC08DRAFT_377624 [Agrocybe pediades]
MQFNLVALAIFAAAGVAMALPSDNTEAYATITSEEAVTLEYLLANRPEGHQAGEDGLAPRLGRCFWSGTSPFCAGGCPSGYIKKNQSSCGDGACCVTGYKILCCRK